MDALTEHSEVYSADRSPVLIAASSESAQARARATIEAAGYRIGATLRLGSACERIELQPAASVIWVELDRDGGHEADRVLECVSRFAASERAGAVVATRANFLDATVAHTHPAVELVVDGDDAERAAALAMATARLQMKLAVGDVASDRNAERLRQLSDEVGRIAATLARLSSNPPVQSPSATEAPKGEVAPVSAETVRSVIRARRLRSRYFPEHLFADPAWDMMLDLLQAEIAQLRVPVSSLCIAAAVPATTALRWLKTLVEEGLFVRRADPHDGRRVFVELAPQTSDALHRYFTEVTSPAVV